MKKILVIAAVAASLTAGSAAAQVRQNTVTLPDGSTVSVVTSRDGGWFRSQEASQLVFLCNPACGLVQTSSTSNAGILPDMLRSFFRDFSIVEAARVLRPSQSETYVSNYADGGRGGNADAYAEGGRGGNADADAESWADAYARNDFDINVDVRNQAPATLPPAPPPTTPCCVGGPTPPPGPPTPPSPPPPPPVLGW